MIKKLLLLSAFVSTSLHAQNTIVFEENFDNEEAFSKWENIDLDKDEMKWTYYEDSAPFGSSIGSLSSLIFYPMNVDDVLVSPIIELPNNDNISLTFKLSNMSGDMASQHYSVYIINAEKTFIGNEEPIFTEVLDADYSINYKTVDLNLSAYKSEKIKIVFRHYETDSKDSFILKLDDIKVEASTLGISEFNKKKINVTPNPTNGMISLSGVDNVKRIKVYDMTGGIILDVYSSKANLSQLKKGTYLVNFYTENEVFSRKVIKK